MTDRQRKGHRIMASRSTSTSTKGETGKGGPGRGMAGGVVVALLALPVALLPMSPLMATQPAGASTAHTLTISTEKVSKVGTVLTTSTGLTLYRFTSDPTGKVTCTGGCAKVWPPLLVAKGTRIRGPHGLKDFGTIHLSNGKLQVSFHGHALYRFAGDKKKGHAAGQGVEGTWFAVAASNTIASTTHVPASTSTSTSTSTTAAPSSGAVTPTTTTKSTVTPTTSTKTTSPPTTSPPPSTTTPTTAPPPPPPPPTTTTTTAPAGGYGY
jgi:predicted lipoprotein with Yx(FWY)xxD motif